MEAEESRVDPHPPPATKTHPCEPGGERDGSEGGGQGEGYGVAAGR
jgi:hypothetical protein